MELMPVFIAEEIFWLVEETCWLVEGVTSAWADVLVDLIRTEAFEYNGANEDDTDRVELMQPVLIVGPLALTEDVMSTWVARTEYIVV